MALRPLRSVVASAAGDSFQGKRSSGVDGVSASTRQGGVWRGARRVSWRWSRAPKRYSASATATRLGVELGWQMVAPGCRGACGWGRRGVGALGLLDRHATRFEGKAVESDRVGR
jgi:hypothetical protein